MKSKIITIIGSYNVGLFLKGNKMPLIGETIIADQFHEGGGGKGSNQAVAAAKFKADVNFIGCLGADKYGINAIEMYKKMGIKTEMIKVSPCIHSGISIILIDSNGNNFISVAPGANLKLNKKDIDNESECIKNSFITGFQLENNHETVFYGIQKAKELGSLVFLDPAPALPLPDELYPYIDIVKPNETEASILTNFKVDNKESAFAAATMLIEKGIKTVIVTLGEKGAVLVNRKTKKYFPAPKVKAIDSTGAGDIFSGAFLSSYANDKSIEEAIEFAIFAASLATTKLGVIESIPTCEEVFKFIEKYNKQL